MDIGEIISDSIKYPSQDWKKIIILGILIILSIYLIIPIVLVMGYFFRILKSSIAGFDELPDFDEWGEMVIDGLKMFVVQFVYLLIPLIVIFVGAWASIASMSVTASGNVANPNLFLGLMGGTAIIGFILAIIFQLIGSIAVANMALNDSEFGAAFRFSEILELISMIGWGKYIIWYIVMIIIGIVFMVIASVLQIIPFIGMIIATLVVYPYLTMFSSRSLALLFGSSVELE
ncbi:MAG: DUF4013 domain-containing protein [Methanobacterium sp.]|uniref:DUF4013 domain-containing protein n=1 Tax=Methanobacterium sp. TaxID=2164 RepID=UPI003D91B6AE